jgi:membrane protein
VSTEGTVRESNSNEEAPAHAERRFNLAALIRLIRETYAAFKADGCRALSAAMVYYSTLSTVPLLILIVATPGLLLNFVSRAAGEELLRMVSASLSPEFAALVTQFLDRVQNQSLAVTGISLLLLIYSSSAGFRFLRYAFRWIWRDEQPRTATTPFARLRKSVAGRTIDYLIAFGMVFAAPLVVAVGLLLFVLGGIARTLIDDVPLVGSTLGTAISQLTLFGIYAGIYMFLLWAMPPVQLRWREIVIPGLTCAIAVLITTYGLSLYLRFFSGSSLYGAIGTIFALQIWSYANFIILFSCAELVKLLVQKDPV